jgi:hypothetical protein
MSYMDEQGNPRGWSGEFHNFGMPGAVDQARAGVGHYDDINSARVKIGLQEARDALHQAQMRTGWQASASPGFSLGRKGWIVLLVIGALLVAAWLALIAGPEIAAQRKMAQQRQAMNQFRLGDIRGEKDAHGLLLKATVTNHSQCRVWTANPRLDAKNCSHGQCTPIAEVTAQSFGAPIAPGATGEMVFRPHVDFDSFVSAHRAAEKALQQKANTFEFKFWYDFKADC